MKATPKARFYHQREGARKRGIEFHLTFEQWLEWWGEDLARRGSGPLDLQMCRTLDVGPYALGNIYKGTKTENLKTAANVRYARAIARRKVELEARQDAMMWAASAPPKDEPYTKDELDLLRATGAIKDHRHGPDFRADK